MTVFEGNRSLLDAFRRGDRQALTAVYGHYVKDVAALVRLGFTMSEPRVVVPGIAEPQRQRDLIQDAFLRAFAERARLSFDGLSPFRPWLLRIVKNLMIDEARRGGRLVGLEEAQTPHADAAHELLPVSPEDELEWKSLREATQAYCAGLDAETRRFVKLRFEEERPQAEVAELLGTTRRQVRTLEERVREGLRNHLKTKGYSPP